MIFALGFSAQQVETPPLPLSHTYLPILSLSFQQFINFLSISAFRSRYLLLIHTIHDRCIGFNHDLTDWLCADHLVFPIHTQIW
jgi:hypothetical protein